MHILGHRNLRRFNALLVLESAHWAINTSHKKAFFNRVAEPVGIKKIDQRREQRNKVKIKDNKALTKWVEDENKIFGDHGFFRKTAGPIYGVSNREDPGRKVLASLQNRGTPGDGGNLPIRFQ